MIFFNMDKMKGIALVAVIAIMLAATMTLAPFNVKATTGDIDESDDDDSPALTMTKKSSNPSGQQEAKEIQSNENSENAAVKITKSNDHRVDKEDRSDDPAHTGNIVFKEDGEVVKEITQESASQSASSVSEGSEAATIPIFDIATIPERRATNVGVNNAELDNSDNNDVDQSN